MKIKFILIYTTLTVILIDHHCFSQGFINLNFESATITTAPGFSFYVLESNAIPGWTATPLNGLDGNLYIGYDTISLGGAAVFLEDTNAFSGGGPLPLQGLYSILLQGYQGDTNNNDSNPLTASIGQTGQIPIGSESLEFWGAGLANFQITFQGQVIPYFSIGNGSGYTIYEANISAFAGDTGQLLFTALANGNGLIDNIQFLTTPVPEPSVFGLSALGSLFPIWRRWRKFLQT